MKPFRRILVATDFSPGAAVALKRAGSLPLARSAVITLVHVVSNRLPTGQAVPAVAARAKLQDAARTLTRRAPRSASIVVKTALLRGNPAAEILAAARRAKAELIVLGRHGRRTFRELVLGSTVERVVRGSDRLVLVASVLPKPYRAPLVAVDFTPAADAALRAALRLSHPGSHFRVVHACHIPFEAVWYRALTPSAYHRDRRECAEDARRALGLVVARLPKPSGILVRFGDPRAVILAAARRGGADLIALGHGRPGLRHDLVGGVCEAVSRAAPCDILVAPA
ncbi:MAG: universal stress protein [Gemmatimonadetes bacterium]|nr:universal stress protein [Gemmatimonadota bacterium]